MIITVTPSQVVAIEGFATSAIVRRDGDKATVAVLAENNIGPERKKVGEKVRMLGGRWRLTKIKPSALVTTFIFRRITDG